jgi:hypothetical protein
MAAMFSLRISTRLSSNLVLRLEAVKKKQGLMNAQEKLITA